MYSKRWPITPLETPTYPTFATSSGGMALLQGSPTGIQVQQSSARRCMDFSASSKVQIGINNTYTWHHFVWCDMNGSP